MGELMDAMTIDCEKVAEIIAGFIRDKIEVEDRDGICMGISGGVDSAVASFLAVRAMGDPKKVYGLHLYDRDSQRKFREYAECLAGELGVNFEVRDISPTIKEKGTYDPLVMKLVPYSNLVNRMILFSNKMLSPLFYGETPFAQTLKRQDPSTLRFGFVAGIAKDIENGFNDRHILRRRLLEDYAEENNLLLVGAANRSESYVGWFVKDGIDDLPVELLLGLYKNQVRQLGRHLGVPEYILGEKPSPDMFKGIGDEDIIGHKYETIDLVAYAQENGLDEEALLGEGVSRGEIESIKRLHELSTWKREAEHEYPSINL